MREKKSAGIKTERFEPGPVGEAEIIVASRQGPEDGAAALARHALCQRKQKAPGCRSAAVIGGCDFVQGRLQSLAGKADIDRLYI